MAEDTSQDDVNVEELLAALVAPGQRFRDARYRLARTPSAVPALSAALSEAGDARTFYRVASTLAKNGTDAAVEALSLYAINRRRFPRLAINALSGSRNPAAVSALLELLQNGLIDQRRAAAFGLSRMGTALAIEPLARKAASDATPFHLEPWGRGPGDPGPGLDAIRDEAWQALRLMGRGRALAQKVLLEPSLSVGDRVRVICALADAFRANSVFRALDPQKYLDGEAMNRRSSVREEARQAAEFLRHRSTLLRPSEPSDAGILLRAAGDPGDADPNRLLRGSSAPDTESVKRPMPDGRRAWWHVVWRVLCRRN